MTSAVITPDAYRHRQRAFAAALAAAGLRGALVVSRGGATADRYGSVRYLTGHYQAYSYLPDAPGLFSGRAHTAFAIAADGRGILCVSVPEYNSAALAADEIRHATHFAEGVANALRDLGLVGPDVGLVGEDVLPLRIARTLSKSLPELDLVPVDELLEALRRIKSPEEQILVREAAAIHRRGTAALLAAVRPGVTEAELVATFAEVVMSAGAGLYFTSMSSSSATERWTSTPQPGFSTRKLQNGDLLRFDIGIVWQGYLSDYGRATTVGAPSADQARLIGVLHAGLEAAITAVRPGARVCDIAMAGEAALAAAGVGDEGSAEGIVSSFPVHWGHGLGMGWERPWLTKDETMEIVPGMVLAIERALTWRGVGTVAAEQNLLVLPHGAELLTAGLDGLWS
jgi:Xaa-Pro dipeptidase